MYAAKVAWSAQGYMLMQAAAEAYGWNLNLGGITLMWRGSCIIRSAFLEKIKDAFDADPGLPNLLLAPYFRAALAAADGAWRSVVATGVELGIPAPTLSSALAFYDGYRRERLPREPRPRRDATTSAHTPTNASIGHRGNSSTRTGPARAAT